MENDFENLTHLETDSRINPTSAMSTQYFASKTTKGTLKQSSSFNKRSKGILRYKKTTRKLKTLDSFENQN